MFTTTIDHAIAFNQAILKFEPLEPTSNVSSIDFFNYQARFPKSETKKPDQVHFASVIAQKLGPKDDLKLIRRLGPEVEKKLQDVVITSSEQLGNLPGLQIADLETDVV